MIIIWLFPSSTTNFGLNIYLVTRGSKFIQFFLDFLSLANILDSSQLCTCLEFLAIILLRPNDVIKLMTSQFVNAINNRETWISRFEKSGNWSRRLILSSCAFSTINKLLLTLVATSLVTSARISVFLSTNNSILLVLLKRKHLTKTISIVFSYIPVHQVIFNIQGGKYN